MTAPAAAVAHHDRLIDGLRGLFDCRAVGGSGVRGGADEGEARSGNQSKQGDSHWKLPLWFVPPEATSRFIGGPPRRGGPPGEKLFPPAGRAVQLAFKTGLKWRQLRPGLAIARRAA